MEFNGTFFATIISFVIFVFLMNKVLYAPIRKIVTERRNFVAGNYSSASQNEQKAEELAASREEKLVEAKDSARKKYNDIVTKFKSERAEIVQKAQQQSIAELEDAYNSLNNVSNEAKEALKGSMNDLANDIVEKVLGYRSDIQGFDNDSVNKVLYN